MFGRLGTPVAIISTLNPDGSPNLAPMSSAWWLGWSCMLGLGQMGQTSDNLIRTRECVINLPSEDLVTHVDRLALTTGKNPVPDKKREWGYRHEPDKFGIAGFTPQQSQLVAPPRVLECPVQMEGILHDFRPFGKNVSANVFEVHIVKLHVDENLLLGDGPRPQIDPVRWRPLIMSFCRFFGLREEVHPSRLAESDFMKLLPREQDRSRLLQAPRVSRHEVASSFICSFFHLDRRVRRLQTSSENPCRPPLLSQATPSPTAADLERAISVIKSRISALLAFLLAFSSMSLLRAQTVASFDGMSASQLGRPQLNVDPDGAVGTRQFMEYVNFYYQGYDKTSFAPVWSAPQVGTTPWTNAGLSNCFNISGNGVITFDRLASRWIIAAHSATTNNYYYCIAVSNTDDLSSDTFAWNAYAIPLNSILGSNSHGNVYFPDWPRLSVWPDAYYLAIDLNDTNQSFKEVGVVVCALDRANMITGGTPRSPQCFTNPSTITGSLYLGHSLIPAEVEGTIPPPAGRNEYLLSIQNPPNDGTTTTSTSLNLWTFHVDWTTPANSTFTQSTLTVPAYRPGCYLAKQPLNTACVPESTTVTSGQHLDSVGDRLEPRFSYRNFGGYESFLMSHAVQVGTSTNKQQTGIRWYEFRGAGTPSLYQSGTINPDQSLSRFVPSLTQDTQGNAGVGYSVSSASTHPGINASWWNLTDRTAATELPLFAGAADQENTTDWGSYTSMTVDPLDGCTFWYVNQYDAVNQTGLQISWNTRISNFKIPTCGTVTASPGSLTYAAQAVGTTSTAQVVTVNNSQTAVLNISSIGLTGANAGDFAQTNTCGTVLPAGQSCTVSVTFSPTAAGTRTATLNVSDDATGGSPQTVSITGTATNPLPIISLSASALNFGNQVTGTTSGASPVTVTNTGNAAANISSIAITGTNLTDFGQTNNCPASLPVNQSCTINVTFTPSATGARSASVTITDNATNSPQNVTLSGTGVAPVTLSATSLSFGAVLVGSTSTLPAVTLTNNQNVALTGITIVASPPVFTQTNTCGTTIAAGAQCTITVTFAPTDGVPYNGTVTITDSASNSPQTITLTGSGRQPVALNPNSLSFGKQTVGTTSNPKTITVQNNQKVTLNISSITIAGTNSGDYAQTNTCGSTLLKGARCTVSVTFTPTAKGNRSATLTVTDSALTSPQTAALTGTGQ